MEELEHLEVGNIVKVTGSKSSNLKLVTHINRTNGVFTWLNIVPYRRYQECDTESILGEYVMVKSIIGRVDYETAGSTGISKIKNIYSHHKLISRVRIVFTFESKTSDDEFSVELIDVDAGVIHNLDSKSVEVWKSFVKSHMVLEPDFDKYHCHINVYDWNDEARLYSFMI